jgi:hypothetical protein
MASYTAHGFSAYEIEVKTHIIRRVFFAISVRDAPKWLSWYFYGQGAGQYGVDFGAASTPDEARKIGGALDPPIKYEFSFYRQIDVNAFANTNKYGQISSSPATCTITKHSTTNKKINYLLISLAIANKLGNVTIRFPLSDEGTMHGIVNVSMPGHLDYVGTVDLGKYDLATAVGAGPLGYTVSKQWLKDSLRPDL